MKNLPQILLLTITSLITGCNVQSMDIKGKQEIRVKTCGFDYDVDNYFCEKDKINLYKNYISAKTNFNKEYTVIKINDGDFYRLVALNKKTKVVYPLNSQVDKKNAILTYSNDKDELCITGDIYAYRDSYKDSKICFKLIDESFIKTNIIGGISKNNYGDKYSITPFPYDSDKHRNCLLRVGKSACTGMHLIPTVELYKNYSFIHRSDGATVILPKDKDGLFLMISPYEEDDAGSAIRVMLVKDNALISSKYIILGNNKITINNNEDFKNLIE